MGTKVKRVARFRYPDQLLANRLLPSLFLCYPYEYSSTTETQVATVTLPAPGRSIDRAQSQSWRRGNLGITLRFPSSLTRDSNITTRFNQQVLIDTTPLPDHIPKVDEIGASSAPLMSASYFIGARCKDYNDDFMLCKTEANGRGELECLKEGRKVTRCAASVLEDINKSCLDQFRSHWKCLENNNQQLWQCRKRERTLNKCVFDNLVSCSSPQRPRFHLELTVMIGPREEDSRCA